MTGTRADIVAELQAEILRLQGFKPHDHTDVDMRLGPMAEAFPNKTFPLGAVHEFISGNTEEVAATSGFISALLSPLMNHAGATLWVSTERKLFPPALKRFGLEPDNFIFLDLAQDKHILWAMEEALKCPALTAVIAEVRELSFTASRRLQLAVEDSRVTGFVLRHNPRQITTTACVSRWRITPLPSAPVDDLPGIGFPQWRVTLERIRNGKPGKWDVRWVDGEFESTRDEVRGTREEGTRILRRA